MARFFLSRCERQLVRALTDGDLTFWELMCLQEATIKEFILALARLRQKGIIKLSKGRFRLTRCGMDLARKLNLKLIRLRCQRCEGTGIILDSYLKRAYERFVALTRSRPLPVANYDQGVMRPLDSMNRVAFIYERGDLEGAEVLIIGDDDLVGLAMALTGRCRNVVVLEIDDRIVEFINSTAKSEGLDLEAISFDVRDDLPKSLSKRFDIFVTDPVETIPGIKLFLSRGAAGLRPKGAGYLGLTHLEASVKKWLLIERMLLDMGFAITDIVRDFSIYSEDENKWQAFYKRYPMMRMLDFSVKLPTVDWFRSSFIRIEAVNRPRPLVSGPAKLGRKFYIDSETLATPVARS